MSNMDQDFTEEIEKIVGKDVGIPLVFIPGEVRVEAHLRTDEMPSVVCTCGWKFGPNSSLLTLGRHAKNHCMETGCHLRGKP